MTVYYIQKKMITIIKVVIDNYNNNNNRHKFYKIYT